MQDDGALPWTRAWPAAGLEVVDRCPVCGSRDRSRMHDGLVDHAFRTAAGRWTMQRCGRCASTYLDPRPTPATIGLAYEKYYTHAPGSAAEGGFARLRRRIALAYVNRRYGTTFAGALAGASMLAWVFPRKRRYLDVSYARHLGPSDAEGGRLLDVGCGNGEFLACAAALGWDAEGIDPDEQAVRAALSLGCRARRATLDDDAQVIGPYRHITLSHVIEHVPHPLDTLVRCRGLLAPGGRIWIETPNVASLGHRAFGAAWRGLEAPRHLVLFNRESLTRALRDAGFERVCFLSHPAVPAYIWSESAAALRDEPTAVQESLVERVMRARLFAMVADLWTIVRPDSAEFLTCVAHRPADDAGGRS